MSNSWKPGPQVQLMPPQLHRRPMNIVGSAPMMPGGGTHYNTTVNYTPNSAQYMQFAPNTTGAPAGNYTDLEIIYSPTNSVPPRRETGIIEKLLQNFGFVQCCDRQARLFFHFSQYSGNIDELKNGDEVEFEAGVDRRTGKPIALNIQKDARMATVEQVTDKRYIGEVTYAPKHNTIIKPGSTPQTELGRLSYENKGEWYFLSFTPLDVSGDLTALKQGDKVSFRVSTDGRTSSMKAREVRLEESAAAPKHQGVICSLKDNFGFIERADCVKEIFFHFSEFLGGPVSGINVGDDVEFEIHTRNGKEVATSVFSLPAGTVQFEDVRPEIRSGVIVKPIPRAPGKKLNPDDPLPARLKYKDELDGECEIVFGDRDQNGEYTLLAGDHVTFNLAIDKRDSLKRATNVTLLEESLRTSGEKRERGTIATLKDGFGFVNCYEKGSRLFFHFSEVLDQKGYIRLNSDVEFSIINTDSPDKQNAVRIKIFGPGSVKKARPSTVSSLSAKSPLLAASPQPNSVPSPITVASLADGETVTKSRGFISFISRSHGFVEAEDYSNEYFFNISACVMSPDRVLELGDEVQFLLRTNGAKSIADNVQPLPKWTIQSMTVNPEILSGEVVRARRTPNEVDLQGLVKERVPSMAPAPGRQFRFSVSSFVLRSEPYLQPGDYIEFKVGTVVKTGEKRAAEIKMQKSSRLKSKVVSVKGEFGFIAQTTAHGEAGDTRGQQLFFHQSEVTDAIRLKPHDEVEYEVVNNQKTNKLSAANIKRISTSANSPMEKSTDRLSHRVRTMSLNNPDAKVAIVREPFTAEGSRGFLYQRSVPAETTAAVKMPATQSDGGEEALFASNIDDEGAVCGEDGSGDYNREEEKSSRIDDKIKSCGDS